MNKLAIAMLIAFSAPAFATGTQGTNGQQQQQQTTVTSGSESQASNAGNTQQIIFSSPGESTQRVVYSGGTESRVSGTTTVRNTPSVSGPPLVSSNDTCMGSVSGSLNVAGFGGSLGTTYKDVNCVMLKNSRELWNMGMRGAALARMCMDSENKEALEITGFVCPQTEREKARAVEAAKDERPEVTDSLVRSRMGLKPLVAAK